MSLGPTVFFCFVLAMLFLLHIQCLSTLNFWFGREQNKGGEEKLNTLEHFGKKMSPGDSAITSHDLECFVHKDDIARVGPLPSM